MKHRNFLGEKKRFLNKKIVKKNPQNKTKKPKQKRDAYVNRFFLPPLLDSYTYSEAAGSDFIRQLHLIHPYDAGRRKSLLHWIIFKTF